VSTSGYSDTSDVSDESGESGELGESGESGESEHVEDVQELDVVRESEDMASSNFDRNVNAANSLGGASNAEVNDVEPESGRRDGSLTRQRSSQILGALHSTARPNSGDNDSAPVIESSSARLQVPLSLLMNDVSAAFAEVVESIESAEAEGGDENRATGIEELARLVLPVAFWWRGFSEQRWQPWSGLNNNSNALIDANNMIGGNVLLANDRNDWDDLAAALFETRSMLGPQRTALAGASYHRDVERALPHTFGQKGEDCCICLESTHDGGIAQVERILRSTIHEWKTDKTERSVDVDEAVRLPLLKIAQLLGTPARRSLVCGHGYHAECVENWVRRCVVVERRRPSCPICRRLLF
jgi:hypothetical protein